MTKILVTGTAGFIGFHLVKRLLGEGLDILGIDNINNYYDINLKYARLAETGIIHSNQINENKNLSSKEIKFGEIINSDLYSNYRFMRTDVENEKVLFELFASENFDYVIHLAAQAGVRHSIENPNQYIQSNIIGFFNILEACRKFPVRKLLYASSSSVYGNNFKTPFSTNDKTDEPISLYAATKKSNELMAHAYSHLYQIPTIGLRFFTVYGSWGRPDMSPMLFADAIATEKPIKVFNSGDMERDFTHVSDIVEGIFKLLVSDKKLEHNYQIFNIGNGTPINLLDYIKTIEKYMGKKAELLFLPMQPGDVKRTWADTQKLREFCNYKPNTNIDDGVHEFVSWFKNYKIS
ncbi:MAG: NAD-dependent epimerase/dehydratase family protein [Prolixibacteraceae bacterium]|nr:NAD-dependent epimerase/dehydratase family protein [Prolixibacteraceae bacterium]